MELRVRLTRDELADLLRQFAPIRIHLTPTDEDRRWVEIERPSSVELLPEVGLRVISHGRLRYKIAGIAVPLTIRRVELLLVPKVLHPTPSEFRLAFELTIRDADLELVPGVVDRAIYEKVNALLDAENTPLVWDFGKTFHQSARLPERLEPVSHFLLSARDAEVHIDGEAISFRVQLGASLSRSKERPTDD
jgi:hypothetical protein